VLLADPSAPRTIEDALPAAGAVAVVIGPEGGFDDDESGIAVAAGAVAVRLGRLILRTETAALVATHAAARG
jgi:16S rRNA (uracil1498-N3)-methyltransferase